MLASLITTSIHLSFGQKTGSREITPRFLRMNEEQPGIWDAETHWQRTHCQTIECPGGLPDRDCIWQGKMREEKAARRQSREAAQGSLHSRLKCFWIITSSSGSSGRGTPLKRSIMPNCAALRHDIEWETSVTVSLLLSVWNNQVLNVTSELKLLIVLEPVNWNSEGWKWNITTEQSLKSAQDVGSSWWCHRLQNCTTAYTL